MLDSLPQMARENGNLINDQVSQQELPSGVRKILAQFLPVMCTVLAHQLALSLERMDASRRYIRMGFFSYASLHEEKSFNTHQDHKERGSPCSDLYS
jgi:hypothetical protein